MERAAARQALLNRLIKMNHTWITPNESHRNNPMNHRMNIKNMFLYQETATNVMYSEVYQNWFSIPHPAEDPLFKIVGSYEEDNRYQPIIENKSIGSNSI